MHCLSTNNRLTWSASSTHAIQLKAPLQLTGSKVNI